MAGETPRAHNLGKNKKKKLNWSDDRSTDKYYGSGNPSAIQHTHGDTVGRPGDPPKAIPVNPAKVDERNADKKYYANPPQPPTVQQRAKSGQLPMPGGAPLPVNSPRQRLAAPSSVNKVVIATVDELHTKMEQLCDLLSGDNHVVVEVPNSDLLRRARAKLDTMVTRELLTEELSRDVRFSKVDAATTPLAPALDLSKPPEPAASVSVDERDGDFLDPAAVLSGTVSVDEPVVDTTPTNVAEAVVTDESDDSDDDGDEFLAPQATTATEETPTVEDSSSAETPADSDDEEPSSSVETASPETSSSDEAATDETDRPKKPGRRSGRGTK